jgi:uncharacterized protein YjbI with pentapeptide repeats
MTKISELGPISGRNTKTGDLFVTVNLELGNDGTKNITRFEVKEALQLEIWDNITITGGSIANLPIANVAITDSTLSNVVIDLSSMTNSAITDTTLDNVIITNSSFSTGTIADSDITDGTMTGTDITNVTIADSTIDNTEITNSSFSTGTIADSDITDGTMTGTTITDGTMTGTEISLVTIADSDITDGTMTGTEITNVTIADSSFIDGILQNTDISYNTEYTPDLEDDSYFIIKDVTRSETVSINYGQLKTELARSFRKAQKAYVDSNAPEGGNGSYLKPYKYLEDAFDYVWDVQPDTKVSITVLPGNHYTYGNLGLPDDCSIISSNGQYATNIYMREGYEGENCFLLGSGCYAQGFAFPNLVIDNFDNPTKGFAYSFRPGARIVRSPYVRDSSQISNYFRQNVVAPLNPFNSQGTLDDLGDDDFPNQLVGRGGGMILADRALLDQDSIFPYFLAFGATPRSPNGLGYVAKNGAGINGIGSLTIFQRCAFYALNGGQITLNNSGTQFGDISMRAKGSINVVQPYEVSDEIIFKSTGLATQLRDNSETIIDFMWDELVTEFGYQGYDSELCRRDTGYIVDGVSKDIALGTNYWSLVNGIAYRRAGSTVVIDDQLTQTSGAITFLKNEVGRLLDDVESETRANASFDEIIDILENGIVNADAPVFADTSNTNQTNSRQQLQNNKSLIQDELITWINSNYPSLSYNETTCRRDTGFIVDALSHDLNYLGNTATIINAEAYFTGSTSYLPEDQLIPTARAIEHLGVICSDIVLGTYPSQNIDSGNATATESSRCLDLANIIRDVILANSLTVLPYRPTQPDYTWAETNFTDSKDLVLANKAELQSKVIAYVNTTYDFVDENLTRRDAANLIKALAFDFEGGTQQTTRNYSAGFFKYNGEHVFSIFGPSIEGLTYKGSVAFEVDLPLDNNIINDAYIIYESITNLYAGDVRFWNGSTWISAGPNDTSLLDSFIYAYGKIYEYIVGNLDINNDEIIMLDALLNDVLSDTLTSPSKLTFGSLIESIAHQFNNAGAGVNTNALPLNFRRTGASVVASGSVLQEDGGRIRWSGADELNNQYFARGLKINGQSGRLEGRPFTSAVRRLARRAANSRASI